MEETKNSLYKREYYEMSKDESFEIIKAGDKVMNTLHTKKEGKGYAHHSVHYDDEGRFTEDMLITESEIKYTFYTYDRYGHCVIERHEDKLNNEVIIKHFKYDKFGRLLRTEIFSLDDERQYEDLIEHYKTA